ncbi:MAG: cob(I)yrinic acid a,c-diamide adenosyltransferase [Candidatus Margulisiibacteriota bacterium]
MTNTSNKILAFIGDGEGKTSAAIGHAVRAAGHGKKVAILQFLKGQERCGEYKYFKKCNGIEIYLVGDPSFFIDPSKKDIHIKKAKEGLSLAKKLISSKEYFLIVLDEIFDAAAAGLISNNDIEGLIDIVRASGRSPLPGGNNLILTGRILPPELSRKIDLVTQMKKIKHYYDLGDKGIEGLDW